MIEKNLLQRLLLIGASILLAALMIIPPQTRLRPGLDIAGGVSMVFEIEEDPNYQNENIAEEMKRLLQRRVDPQGVFDLQWFVHGKNRLEVRMPLPPAENEALREAYLQAQEALFAHNMERSAIERMMYAAPEQRPAEIARLAENSPQREELLQKVAAAADALQAARAAAASQPAEGASQPAIDPRIAVRNATEALEDAIDAVRELNLDPQRFVDVIEMDPGSSAREQNLSEIKAKYPTLAAAVDEVVARHAAWRAKRAKLEGPADLRRLIRGAGVLEFRILADPSPENPTQYDRYRKQLADFGPRPQPGDTYQWFRVDNPVAFLDLPSAAELNTFNPLSARLHVVDKHNNQWYVLSHRERELGLLGQRNGGPNWKLTRAGVTRDDRGRRAVSFELDQIGGNAFSDLTGANVGRQLCILLDDIAYSAANINQRIGSSGIIMGDFSNEKLYYLIQTMQAGALPARLKDTPISERTIGSSLGQTNLNQALRAGLIGLALTLVAMAVYYGVSGMIANVAMMLNLLFTLAVLAMIGARFNLPGIAGIILGIGMAVDANVLIYERMREEKERGASLRMIIKNGYDKALSTILDSNLTTLLTCVILYYAGSEEIKGFGLTLGWGVVLNLFTAVFVTKTFFGVLLKYRLVTDLKMLRLIPTPTIDWYGMRHFFVPLSIILNVVGLGLLVMRGQRDTFDVEFLGGVNAEIELRAAAVPNYNDEQIRRALATAGGEIETAGRKLADVQVAAEPDQAGTFRVSVPGLKPKLIAALIAEPLEDGESGKLLERDGVQLTGGDDAILVRVKPEVTAETLRAAIVALADQSGDSAPLAGANIARSNIGAVIESGDAARGRYWNVTTTETNKRLVQYALTTALGDDLQIQPALAYSFEGRDDLPFPITTRRLSEIAPDVAPQVDAELTDYLGGALIVFNNIDPPQTAASLRTRLRNMRLQPDFQDLPFRRTEVFGLVPAGADETGAATFSRVAIAVSAEDHPFAEDAELWKGEVAAKELSLATTTLSREQTLRKVTQFKPQIAAQAKQRALIALLLSWGMIIAYLWVRFGRPIYGFAGVTALVHDVCVALSFVGIAGWIPTLLGRALLIEDFKIDMTIIAAILTIIGYSINDTIVIFDRIREMRGRLGVVSPRLINDAVNQTMSRTLLTAGTVFLVLLALYIFGGASTRGFAYCMLIGVVTGSYSSIAIAAPLLLLRARDVVDDRRVARPATA